MTDYLDEVFAPGGLLATLGEAAGLPRYEHREEQVTLAREVDRALGGGDHLLAEAGTGVGKTIAYLVPVIHHAALSKKRAVVVTANVALQEQLIDRDLPALAKVLPWPFTYAILKGFQRYLCLSALEDRLSEVGAQAPAPGTPERAILEWAARTRTGDASELPVEPPPEVWRRYSVATDECHGDACQYFESCHPHRARQLARAADVVVTNYHAFFLHCALRAETGGSAGILPKYLTLVLDEAHRAADAARGALGWEVVEGQVRWCAAGLPPTDRGLLEAEARGFFEDLREHRRSDAYRVRLRAGSPVAWVGLVERLRAAAAWHGSRARQILEQSEGRRSADERRARQHERRSLRAGELACRVEEAMTLGASARSAPPVDPTVDEALAIGAAEERPARVYYVDVVGGGDKPGKSTAPGRVALCARPVDVSGDLRQWIFPLTDPETPADESPATVLTSATLRAASGGRVGFDYVAGEVGARSADGGPARTIALGSPFKYRERALLVLPEGMPDPRDPEFPGAVAEAVGRVVAAAGGRTLALFTSYKNLRLAADHLRNGAGCPHRVLVQGEAPRSRLVEAFREDVSSVLLGTASLWEGVDAPGEACSCVVVDRLPFPSPDDPVGDAVAERDRDWFQNWSLPRAVLALKQGFGRLIRSSTDRGVVVVLDRRVVDKSYGRLFLEALPPVARSRRIEDVQWFLEGAPPLPER